MPASFLHGVECIELQIGPVPITVVPSAVVGLVGSAPLFAASGAIQLWDGSWLVSAAPKWSASTSEVIGNLVVDNNGNTQKCTAAGTTGTGSPLWARTVNSTTLDGTVTWTMIAAGSGSAGQQCIDANGNIQTATAITLNSWIGSTPYAQGALVVDNVGNTQRVTSASGTSGSGTPSWSATLGGSTSPDGNLTWTCVAIGRAAVTKLSAPAWATTLNATTADSIAAATGTVTWTLTAKGPINNLQVPVLVSGSNPNSSAPGQAGVFGPLIQGYTIPYALSQVFAQGAGQAIVVNVFDQTLHFSTVSAVTYTFPSSGVQAITVGHMGLSNIIVTNSGATVTYVEGADFTVDHVNGIITTVGSGLIGAGQSVKITYNYADPSQLADANLVGGISVGGAYTGMQCWKLSYGLMGFFPKLLIAPSFGTLAGAPATIQIAGSQDASVAAGMAAIASAIRAMYFIDCPIGTIPSTLISNRGATGNAWNTSDKRAVLCGPEELIVDNGIIPTAVAVSTTGTAIQNFANVTRAMPFSPFVAGATSGKDLAQGYWWSPSNTPVIGPLGPDVSIYSSFTDASSDTNTLNAQGIVTSFQSFGTGLRVWGNRSAGYPSFTTPDVFISVRRTMDVIEQSVQLAMMQFLDQPISNALITSILATVNAFVRTLIGRGALVAGAASYNPIENPPSQIANGQLVFDIDVMPPPPAERLTFNVFIDTTLLSALTGQAQGQTPSAQATV